MHILLDTPNIKIVIMSLNGNHSRSIFYKWYLSANEFYACLFCCQAVQCHEPTLSNAMSRLCPML